MYPLHKYQPTPFGTYFMYIDHGLKRVPVKTIPEDIAGLKKKLEKGVDLRPLDAAKDTKSRKPAHQKIPVPPSYDIHFLQHKGQAIVEPPSNVIIVDHVTGADVTSSKTWIRNRPRGWDSVVKLHQIENPAMTSTVVKPYNPIPTKQPSYPAGDRLKSAKFSSDFTPNLPELHPAPKPSANVHQKMQPHVYKQLKHSRQQELIEARSKAVRKRRKQVQKKMSQVAGQAQLSAILSSRATDQTVLTNAGTKTGMYLNGKMPTPDPNDIRRIKIIQPIRQESSSPMKTNTSKYMADPLEHVELQAKDWNPREDQKKMNRVLVDRLTSTVPYQWNNKVNATGNSYKYVL